MPPKSLEKDLKQPDEFVSFWTRVGAKVAAHRGLVLGVVAGLLLLGVGLLTAGSVATRRAEKQSVAFARIERVAAAALLSEQGAAPGDDDVPHFKTDAERRDAAIKEADAFLANHGSSPLAEEARLLKARHLLAGGKAQDALPIYQAVVAAVDPKLSFIAREGLAHAQESAGQVDAAIATFTSLAADMEKGSPYFRDRAAFGKARLLEAKGARGEAEKAYRDLLQASPAGALREEVSSRLAALEERK